MKKNKPRRLGKPSMKVTPHKKVVSKKKVIRKPAVKASPAKPKKKAVIVKRPETKAKVAPVVSMSPSKPKVVKQNSKGAARKESSRPKKRKLATPTPSTQRKSGKGKSAKTKMKAKKKPTMTKRDDKEYQSLYRKILRRKKAIQDINSVKARGYKSKRTKIYRELVELNKEIKQLSKKRGYKIPESVLAREKRLKQADTGAAGGTTKKRDVERKTLTYIDKVWDFEDKLAKIIKSKEFKIIYIKNVNKKFTQKSAPSTILYWYDMARDMAYNSPFMSTPFVEVEENYMDSIITIEVQ